MTEKKKDTQSRKYLLTINNPLSEETEQFTHDKIKDILNDNFPSVIYYCLADERGLNEDTHHTHIFIIFSGGVRFSTVKKHFSTAHIDKVLGTNEQNRDYVGKFGKWEDDEKGETSIPDTFFEWGELPAERQSGMFIEAIIIDRIQDGATNAEILLEFPHYLRGLRDVEYGRQTLRAEEYRKWRTLETVYIWGSTGTGKTRSVMDGEGYANVYAVNDYKHPFDGYMGESVMLFDEFVGNIRIQDMNRYLDGYPIALPARYSNKQACYEKVYIISNLELKHQYRYEQMNYSEVWAAFLRRIHKVIYFDSSGEREEYTTQEYLTKKEASKVSREQPEIIELPFDEDCPF
jgi:hypothetical protein